MENDPVLVGGIRSLFGADIYVSGKLDRPRVSSIVFANPRKLQQLNTLVHPATIAYAAKWIAEQDTPYIIKEAAIFFESGSYTEMDVMVEVYAPQELRMLRAMKRSMLTREKVLEICDY